MEIKARVPGTIKEINVKAGDAVKVKQVVAAWKP
jgi:pyruvate/2-oxoglutarate dehydrogenase complex dihydrolipoamide acyltransferase (E2) component